MGGLWVLALLENCRMAHKICRSCRALERLGVPIQSKRLGTVRVRILGIIRIFFKTVREGVLYCNM